MPAWSTIQSQLRHPTNPVVFMDISVGNTVSLFMRKHAKFYDLS